MITAPVPAFVMWPDGVTTVAYELGVGTLVAVTEVVSTAAGFVVRAQPVETPELFAYAPLSALHPVGERVPF